MTLSDFLSGLKHDASDPHEIICYLLTCKKNYMLNIMVYMKLSKRYLVSTTFLNFLGFQLPLGLTLLALLRLLITISFNTFILLRLPNLI